MVIAINQLRYGLSYLADTAETVHILGVLRV